MIENDKVIIADGKEISAMMLDKINNPSSTSEWEGEWTDRFLKVSVVGYFNGKVVIHSEELSKL